MLFRQVLNPESNWIWTLFHIGLAAACTITPYALVAWFYFIFLTNIADALGQLAKGKYYFYVALLFYLVSFEMLGRMAKAAPFVPTELGKYFLLLFVSLGILLKGIRSTTGLTMVLLLLPALLYDLSGLRTFVDIIYNFFGPLATALGITLLYRAPVTQFQINRVLHMIWYTSLTALIFTFLKTPDLDTIEFNLKAEFATTANTSSNQVATILGLGMFLSFYSIINRLKFSGNYFVDIGFMLLFAFQGLLSFSRGGMLIPLLGMAVLFFFRNRQQMRVSRGRMLFGSIVALLGLYFIFQVTNQITDGNLLLRYTGETQGTLLGSKEKTADVIVSRRFTIMQEDLDLWAKHPMLGVGAASSRYLRDRTQFVSPHIEFSRLLAEHGLMGLLYFLLLLAVFRKAYSGLSPQVNKGLFIALFTFALLTTFHAAMRTYVSPALFILASLLVLPDAKQSKNNANIVDRRYKPKGAATGG